MVRWLTTTVPWSPTTNPAPSSIYLSTYLSTYLRIYLSIYLSICLGTYLPYRAVPKNTKMHWITLVIFLIGAINLPFKLVNSDTDRKTIVYASASTTFVDSVCHIYQYHSGRSSSGHMQGAYPCLPLALNVGAAVIGYRTFFYT